MKVGFAGRWDPLDKNSWSGIYNRTYQAIRQNGTGIEVFQYKWPWYLREWLILHKQVQKLKNKKVAVEFLQGYATWFSRQLEKDLLKTKLDILYVPAAPQLIAYCKTNVPIIFMTDATFKQIQGYYDSFDNLAAYNIRQGVLLDKYAFENAAHCMLASSWAKQSAINDYHIPENKITVVPFGANLETYPRPEELKQGPNKICRLLFLGVEWERKGGQIALDTFYSLQKRGIPVQLTIIGCLPPVPVTNKDISVIPYINRNKKKEAGQLQWIIRNSDFLLVPTRAECAGIVFCEASAYGVPSITTDTGGVTTNVTNGVNGYALPFTATAGDYADKIEQLFLDKERYQALSLSSRKKFEEELNWENWGIKFHNIAAQILNK